MQVGRRQDDRRLRGHTTKAPAPPRVLESKRRVPLKFRPNCPVHVADEQRVTLAEMENAFFVPLLPGKKDAAIAFANALMSERVADFDNAQTTVTKESWFLQETPMGDFVIVYYHAPDLAAVHSALATSEEPFDVWFRAQILDLTGIDISTPLEDLPIQALDWSSGETDGLENAFITPILPGKWEAAMSLANSLVSERKAERDAAPYTTTKESWFFQRTPMGDFGIVYYHAPDLLGAHNELAMSNEPFHVWYRQQVLDITGIDISTPRAELPQQILSWSRSQGLEHSRESDA